MIIFATNYLYTASFESLEFYSIALLCRSCLHSVSKRLWCYPELYEYGSKMRFDCSIYRPCRVERSKAKNFPFRIIGV